MIKYQNDWDLSTKVHKSEGKIQVKPFPDAKTPCIKDYVTPSLRSKPNHFILLVGTNDISSIQTFKVIVNKILDLATSLKNNQHDLSVSNIILRTDNNQIAKRFQITDNKFHPNYVMKKIFISLIIQRR